MKFPYKCCRCGFCCLSTICPIGEKLYGLGTNGICRGLSFDGDNKSYCAGVKYNIMPIGDGCCIKARAFKDGVQYDFAALPEEVKIREAQRLRRSR